ncbi:hypothetical protein E2C01_053230 [Portunus trituberculatus]|uniref:Uncharacterized protein n=1 Tax=Portunus trituberculatus TaxID=210409 RepID=A0A5B7GRG0_PORTR|nr:hypothetical protein [Portunus trituberculatus]
MPLHSEKWSRKRKIDHGSEWRPLYMHPRPTTRATGGAACSSAVLEASGSRDEGASALQGSGAGHLSSVPAGRDEEAGDEGAFGVAAAGGKLSGGKININVRNASALLPDPAHLPHYKLVKLFYPLRFISDCLVDRFTHSAQPVIGCYSRDYQ